MFTYTINDENIATIYNDGVIIEVAGPWVTADGAEEWASIKVSRLNDGSYYYGKEIENIVND